MFEGHPPPLKIRKSEMALQDINPRGIGLEITIENMSSNDRDEVISVFNEGVRSGDLVMDIDDPGTRDIGSGWNLVARARGRIVGWVTVDPAGDAARPGVASVGVFVKPEYRRMGIGRAMLDAACALAARSGVSALVAGIVPRNVPALLLHKKCGFRAIGMVRKAGIAGGTWQSAVLLERRSA